MSTSRIQCSPVCENILICLSTTPFTQSPPSDHPPSTQVYSSVSLYRNISFVCPRNRLKPGERSQW